MLKFTSFKILIASILGFITIMLLSILFYFVYISYIIHAEKNIDIEDTTNDNNLKLDLVQVVFRHGDRTPKPIEVFPNEPKEDLEFYEQYGYVQLTQKGKQREYHLGEMLRKTYDSFLQDYRPGDVMALSTNTDRTVTSLQMVLAGLYPPKNESIWNPEIPWMPIPFYTVLSEIDGIFELKRCSKYKDELNEIRNIIDKPALSNDEVFVKLVENNTGSRINIVDDLANLWFLFEAKLSMGKAFPDWCSKDCQQKFMDYAKLYNSIFSHTTSMKRYRGGTLLKHFLNNLEKNVTDEGEKRKIYLYSAHDTNIAAMAKVLNIPNHQIPQYGSAVVLEKYINLTNNEVFLKLGVFNDDGIDNYQSTKLPNCSTLCPVRIFIENVREFLPTDDDIQCQLRELPNGQIERITTVDGQKGALVN